MIDVDQRISAALNAAADSVQDDELRTELTLPPRHRRRFAPALAAAAVLCVGVGLAFVSARHDGPATTTSAGGAGTPPVASEAASESGAPTGACTSTACSNSDTARAAFQFVQDRLGFTGLGPGSPTMVEVGGDSWFVVGSNDDAHVNLSILVRSAPDDGTGLWQLSGTTGLPTDATPMTVDQPSYGTQVGAEVTVAGSAPGQTGTVRIAILASGSADAVATGRAEIGTDGAWQAGLAVPDTASGPLTVVASVGGTDTSPAAFAVTGVYAS